MAINCAQVPVATSAVPVVVVPNGPSTLTLSNSSGSSNIAYIGLTSNVTAGTGFVLNIGATVSIDTFASSLGCTLYAITGGSATLGFFLSTAE